MPIERTPSVADVVRHFHALAADRLRMDEVFVGFFRESGLVGPVWDEYLRRLLGYGLTIVTSLVRSGSMFARCGQHGHHLHQQTVPPDEVGELANEAVWEGFVYFRDNGLIGKRWSVEHGQPLNEYFVNACVLAFPNVYRRWQTRVNGWRDVQLMDSWSRLQQIEATGAPEDIVVARAAVDAVFAELSEDSRTLLFLHDQNYSHAEIAELMRLTPRGVEARLRRARLAARRHTDRER
ncbi:sigma factor-like helix-turn-helix DNA-binding protein [Lentzea sp. NPDC051213]|uniref:sigma factor-like helix-turn-helix DNA-binding protein n=1 Tax=Lentzea sp. NPDC051213 TaxID=3364126 RepID=UPI0037BA11F7